MAASFLAYVDESGDEGFTFRADGTGSSRWLILSGVVCRQTSDPSVVEALRSARSTLGWNDKKDFHFANMRHECRLVLLHALASTSFRTVTIISYKPDIPDPERYQANKCLLYRYLTRLLIERISWLARDYRRPGEGDGTVELIFSDRASMSYDDLRSYVSLLKRQSDEGSATVQIHWPAISMAKLKAVAHSQLAGLQVADAVASGYLYGIRPSRLGTTDPSYMRLLRGHVYRYRRARFGYGVKFISSFETLQEKMPHLRTAFQDW